MRKLIIEGCTLESTCRACPEQYDVFFGDFQIGYLRLRHGFFRADYPDVGGDTVYSSHTRGDGCFEDNVERTHHLVPAIKALIERHNEVVIEKWEEGYD